MGSEPLISWPTPAKSSWELGHALSAWNITSAYETGWLTQIFDRTVAEFVSNETIYRRVCEIRIDESQGFYFHELERPF
jgi:hypothetical protein